MGSGTGNGKKEPETTPFPVIRDTRAVTWDEVTLAQEKLSMLLDRDETEPQDFSEAAAWFRKAAEQGDARAQATLGMKKRPKLTADKLKAYKIAAKKIWGSKAELPQIRKGEDTDHSTSYVERHNRTIRMANRRFTRKTDAFSKKLSKHEAAMHLFVVYYNFCRIHQTLRVTPAMEAGLSDKLRDLGWIVDLIDEITKPPKKPGPKKGAKYRSRKSVE